MRTRGLTAIRLGNLVSLGALLALLWLALAGMEGWYFASPAIALILYTFHVLFPKSHYRLSIVGLMYFGIFFLRRSLYGGLDVAWRALAPELPIDVHLQEHQFKLPPGPGRTIFIASLSLMPGTLSVALNGSELLVHSIAGPVDDDLEALEKAAEGVFISIEPSRVAND